MNMQLLYDCRYRSITSMYRGYVQVVAVSAVEAEREVKRLYPNAWEIECTVTAFVRVSDKHIWVLK